MLLLLRILVFLAGTASACFSDKNHTCLNIYNKCPFPVYPAFTGTTVPADGGFRLEPWTSKVVQVPNGWQGKIWSRMQCDERMFCATGDCGTGKSECEGKDGKPPYTMAEFKMNPGGSNGQDRYTISLANGYNVHMIIIPIDGTFRFTKGNYDCSIGGGCVDDLISNCPNELQVLSEGRLVACNSPCHVFKSDLHCCRGKYNTSSACPVSAYGAVFKMMCPASYSYPFDMSAQAFTCRGKEKPSAAYTVQFC
ncbi:unnamed protein product, partial [Mesorhabditis spiculigera]